MTAKHLGNRTERRKRRKQAIFRLILGIVAILCLLVGGIGIWQHLQTSQQTGSATSSSLVASDTSQNQASSSTASSSNSENSQKDTSVKWVKQDQPVQLPILMYHAIHIMDPSEEASANLIVAPDVFESHLKALQDEGYYSVTPEEAYKILSENVLPNGNKKVVWLTFDDSNEDFYTIAYPLLTKYQTKATNNVITGFVSNGYASQLTLDQIIEMKKKGMSFESHTVNHPDLSASAAESQNSELAQAKAYLDENLDQKTNTIAYPSGRYSDITLQTAEALGYQLGVTTNEGIASAADGLLSLNRVRILPTTTAQDLLTTIAVN